VTRAHVKAPPRTRLARRPARSPEGGRGKRVAIVTGAARGIGAATVRRLAADGWSVVALDRAQDDPRLPYAMGSERELRALAGERVITVQADACDADALLAVVKEAEERWGGLDAFVAAAGAIAGGVPAWELDPEQEQAVLDVNLVAVLAAVRAGVPALLRRPEPRDGRFIAVASTAATRGLPMLAAYCAAKAAVTGLIRALAVELGDSGVTANAVSPGSTRTAMLEESARLYDLASVEEFAAKQPIGRLVEPDEVAALIAWLAGPQSRGATGGNYVVDGGLSL
jgi:SDR family mycofactocin-dependent oxidoreductase